MEQSQSAIESELESYTFSFPILEKLSIFLESSAAFADRKIAWHCHLTGLTAASAKVLVKAGAKLFLSECNTATTNLLAVDYMKGLGISVYLGADSPARVLAHAPELISDTGFVLCWQYLAHQKNAGKHFLKAACEITTSGIERLRLCAKEDLNFPVININGGALKTNIENYHGVGDGVTDALFRLTGRLWSGRRAAVIGYGSVGKGVAEHLRRSGALVCVVEQDPVRRLLAHYDGFALAKLPDALFACELAVTATGTKGLIAAAEFAQCRDGIILMNVGHWPEEIEVPYLQKHCLKHNKLVPHLEAFELACQLNGSKNIYIAGGAGPANVVMLSGSVEPTLIHLCTEILTLHYVLSSETAAASLRPGENPLPLQVEQEASRLALKSLGLE